MTKISILYPNREGSRFDLLYYLDAHIPRTKELLSSHPGFKGVSVDRGAAAAEPGTDAPYVIMCHLLFDSLEDFQAAFAPHSTTLQEDVPNYTDIQPLIQISDVLLSQTREADAIEEPPHVWRRN
jgi:uncharacterized protein (TIGR02118 family)